METWTPIPENVTVEIALAPPKPVALDPARTALVIVDMQKALCDPGFPRYHPRFGSTIAGNRRILDLTRMVGAERIFIKSIRVPNSPEFTVFGAKPKLLVGSPETEIVDELQPIDGEPIVEKYTHDPFARSGLDDLLDEKGIIPGEWSIIVTGVNASVCAHAAVLGFSNRNFHTVVPVDCTASRAIEDEAVTFRQYLSPAYNFNVELTRSDLISFES
ncbi:MAG: cysteine hydrolase [Cryobacterium sp.]|nr:cysteine hydrolase [Cryobacterium sp.]